ncbi:MAG: alanine racemase [Patescibacteria group bacterium]
MNKKLANGHLRTWIEVDEQAVKQNYLTFRRLLGPQVKLLGVVKSNAYGHGLVPFSKLLASFGVDWLGVDSITEAWRLREEGITAPILVFGHTRPENFISAAAQAITLTISTPEALLTLTKLKLTQPLKIHLKFDTGMHRQGFLIEDFYQNLSRLKKLPPTVLIEGAYSHLAAASSARLASSVARQIKEFEKFLTILNMTGLAGENLLKHLAATGGAVAYPEARYDLIRPGLGLYGYWPSREWHDRFSRKIKLRPALIWKTIIGELKTLTRNDRVGYDLTERVRAGTKLAILPVGYWHGYPRALSGRGWVKIKNQRAKVVGRVSMDMLVVEVTKIKNLRVGDEATLLDQTARELAEPAGTSVYELITRLNPLIERFYV